MTTVEPIRNKSDIKKAEQVLAKRVKGIYYCLYSAQIADLGFPICFL